MANPNRNPRLKERIWASLLLQSRMYSCPGRTGEHNAFAGRLHAFVDLIHTSAAKFELVRSEPDAI